ncbi:hydroxyphenylacetyl-CoA thioesterase PaaI [Altererythrobacter sp. B11]|uniref:hydroxyphenylacetyl-CoA thioesterase PaaI n=1 Tax=Altererythrobacter sp. B11 TaxID=2060312 RepID=UPI001E2B6826|nr:hydroxyphenylacetyl-CoA thioesterase PaaI [Altererythrobacter sp. B11]
MAGRTIIGKSHLHRYDGIMLSRCHTPKSPAELLAWRVAVHLLSKEGTGAAWALTLEAADEGMSRVSMLLTPAMLNGLGTAHGGMIFSLADSAFAYACNSRNIAAVAQSCAIAFIDAGRPGERLVAEAHEIALRGRTGSYVITVTGEDGRVVATMQGLSRSLGRPVIEGLHFND